MRLDRRLREFWTLLSAAPDSAFNWKAYVTRYPDLRQNGIRRRRDAVEHWVKYGAAEGRVAARVSYEPGALMCASFHSIFLRATGNIVCWDNAGSDTVLQSFDERIHYGRDVYLGEPFNSVRRKLDQGRMPFEVCQRCIVLRSRTPGSAFQAGRRVVEVFQVEPSYKCTLDCPACVRLDQRRLAPPKNLEPEVLRKILMDLADSRIVVRAFDFQGLGEPLLNPKLWGLTRIARDIFPTASIAVTTNAHGAARETVLVSGIDEIVCSIDGVSQETFEPYRIHGNFELAYGFMKDVKRLSVSRGGRLKVIWKYVLFEHNSSPEDLERAQTLAAEAGVDELVFVFTRSGPRSARVQNVAQMSLSASSVRVSFRRYEPDVTDLFKRLEEARFALGHGARDKACEIAGGVLTQLRLFFPESRFLTPMHRTLIEQLQAIGPDLEGVQREQLNELCGVLGMTASDQGSRIL